ncbi:hypothetical protein KWV42_10450 [Clostridioides difficile]|uniref:DarT1-associated NADAR antitoxin family protein n=1 Tax=Clostridioides difficile TaxID=1496 RepID=UPI0010B393A0|nr:hypothetical protein [Clostridioides difficile]MBY1883506.1 hypothetical protein [Clostridioides difficile]MBZ0781375.1 hypothetical protein [Clostridioides difficile]MBZ0855019.1 hypothetical protein [Clostridioides difficile]MCG7701631.1 hypothetical protein [Clostridioides difficile]
MAKRPVFVVNNNMINFFDTVNTEFEWYSGFSISQKQKSIKSLHTNFINQFENKNILEISSKSMNNLGVQLSAFNLKIKCDNGKSYTVESLFQSSKVFKDGTDNKDLLDKTSLEAKQEARSRNTKELVYFDYFGYKWELEPKTMFYDWLYINAVAQNKKLLEELVKYDAFTDIEFNPNKSFNCQAKSAAMLVTLYNNNMLEVALQSVENYKQIVMKIKKEKVVKEEVKQLTLF